MELKAKKREIVGKKVKSLRQQGILPAVVFGKETGSIPITLDKTEFLKVYEEVGESSLVDVHLPSAKGGSKADKPIKVLIAETDIDPVSGEIIHANLRAVTLTEKATATIPIEIVGESPIVKSGEGMLLTLLDEIEVEALPQDLPSEIKVGVSNLTEIDQGITVKDLPVDRSKVEIKQDPEDLVVKVAHAEMEEEEEVKEEVPVEEAVEVTTERREEEGESSEEEKEK